MQSSKIFLVKSKPFYFLRHRRSMCIVTFCEHIHYWECVFNNTRLVNSAQYLHYRTPLCFVYSHTGITCTCIATVSFMKPRQYCKHSVTAFRQLCGFVILGTNQLFIHWVTLSHISSSVWTSQQSSMISLSRVNSFWACGLVPFVTECLSDGIAQPAMFNHWLTELQ